MENIVLNIISKAKIDNRFILGIDGLSRSGKTTLVKKVSKDSQDKKTPFYVFHMDDHIVEHDKRYNTGYKEWFEYYHLQWDVQWDVQWLIDHFFKKLKEASELKLPFYDKESDTPIYRNIKLSSKCIILIEGVFIQRSEWKRFFDYVVFLDCPRDKRFLRESSSTQKNVEKFRNRYWKAEDYYLITEGPINQADLVIKEKERF
ncbi:kinase [Virgibacillus necropolis]|uniref:Uridine kinase n=1 Tax=Virgibacillus necropolis TaxID=163877 RepID=A0A221MEB5_9BACI|nr:kinase [Virgibacillus necropolis]ASN06018.1 uridine kinase [Virgibacillus necropolis]